MADFADPAGPDVADDRLPCGYCGCVLDLCECLPCPHCCERPGSYSLADESFMCPACRKALRPILRPQLLPLNRKYPGLKRRLRWKAPL